VILAYFDDVVANDWPKQRQESLQEK